MHTHNHMQAHTCRDTQKLQDTVGSVTSAARQDKTGKMESIEGEERKGEERRGKERRREEERGEEGGVALKSFRWSSNRRFERSSYSLKLGASE